MHRGAAVPRLASTASSFFMELRLLLGQRLQCGGARLQLRLGLNPLRPHALQLAPHPCHRLQMRRLSLSTQTLRVLDLTGGSTAWFAAAEAG